MKFLGRLLVALGVFSRSSIAETSGDGVFQIFDKNRDGKVTTDERANANAFGRYDLDKDGAISLAEYNQFSGKPAPSAPRAIRRLLARRGDGGGEGPRPGHQARRHRGYHAALVCCP